MAAGDDWENVSLPTARSGGCDLVALRVRDISHGDQFEITQATRDSAEAWIRQAKLKSEDFLFPSRIHGSPHIGARQYARVLHGWILR
jgi:hypothetical protein